MVPTKHFMQDIAMEREKKKASTDDERVKSSFGSSK